MSLPLSLSLCFCLSLDKDIEMRREERQIPRKFQKCEGIPATEVSSVMEQQPCLSGGGPKEKKGGEDRPTLDPPTCCNLQEKAKSRQSRKAKYEEAHSKKGATFPSVHFRHASLVTHRCVALSGPFAWPKSTPIVFANLPRQSGEADLKI